MRQLQREPLDPVNAVKASGNMCSSKLAPRVANEFWWIFTIHTHLVGCSLSTGFEVSGKTGRVSTVSSRVSQPNPKALSTTESVFGQPLWFSEFHSQPLLVVPCPPLHTGLLSFLHFFWIRNGQWMVAVNISGELTMRQAPCTILYHSVEHA